MNPARRMAYTQVDASQWVVGHQYGRRTGPVDRATSPGRFHRGRPSYYRDRSTRRLRHADEERFEVLEINGFERRRRPRKEHVMVTQLKRAAAAIGEGAEKVGIGKEFVAQAKFLFNENMRIWGRVTPILLLGGHVSNIWSKPQEAFN